MSHSLVKSLAAVTNSLPDVLTAPTGPASINNTADADLSLSAVLPAVLARPPYRGYLVACYSDHPLVSALKQHTSAPVTGIFEASVTAALLLLKEGESFGIISTGKVWEDLLTAAVRKFLGAAEGGGMKFKGVETTGLNAGELHVVEVEELRTRMKDATKRLARKGPKVGAICLGCAGMVGMEEMVREALVEELGEEGKMIRIVDGVLVGYLMLEGLTKIYGSTN